MVIFRENTEDIYAGIEFEHGTEENRKFKELFKQAFPKAYAKIRFPETSGIGFKPVSLEGTERLFKSALEYAIANKRRNVTIVHKGNIQKFTEGAFRNWAYALAERDFGDKFYTWEQWGRTKADKGEKGGERRTVRALKSGRILVKDAIADIALQQVLTRPDEFDVIATDESERRLYIRRAGSAGGRHRHCAGRQHQLCHRPRGVRGHAWHGPKYATSTR
jgi:isocitrate dehydrogenase